MRVDKEKGYIDLSKRRVSAEDVIKCEERYNKSKAVHSITRHVAEKAGVEMDVVNEMVTWPLYKKYGHAFEAFKLSITSVIPSSLLCLTATEDGITTGNRIPSSQISASPPKFSKNCAPTSPVVSLPNPSKFEPISK